MATVRLRHVTQDRDRHGNVRHYFRVAGRPKVRLAGPPGSAAYATHYAACRAALASGEPCPPARQFMPGAASQAEPPASAPARPTPGTWRWLATDYFRSAAFRALGPTTQRTTRAKLESTFDEAIAPGSERTFGEMPLAKFGRQAVVVLRDRKSAFPEAANNRLKSIRRVFRWALGGGTDVVRVDPTRDVARIRVASLGFHTWTVGEVEAYRAHHPVGTTARLALEMLLLLGVRRSDVVRIGRQHRRGDTIRFVPVKGSRRAPQMLVLPILPELSAVIDATRTGDLAYLVTAYGRPFSPAGFGNRFRAWCDAAGLRHCSAHGLRKAGATIAAENGATTHQLMAIFGWRSFSEAERYTKAARQKSLADGAMGLLIDRSAPEVGQARTEPLEKPRKTSPSHSRIKR
ncbi:MAG: site-specific integrase [Hyphomicrobium sp.]|nr:site-specific integrase [Hyphomicrobium sp.]